MASARHLDANAPVVKESLVNSSGVGVARAISPAVRVGQNKEAGPPTRQEHPAMGVRVRGKATARPDQVGDPAFVAKTGPGWDRKSQPLDKPSTFRAKAIGRLSRPCFRSLEFGISPPCSAQSPLKN